MSRPESFEALRQANPRHEVAFQQAVEAVADVVRARIAADAGLQPAHRPRRRVARAAAGGTALATAAAAIVLVAVASLSRGPGVEDASAAVEKAASATAASADRSGTAVVRITRGGELWAGRTIRWHGDDLSLSNGFPRRGKPGSEMRVVDGTLYDLDPAAGEWVVLGDVVSIDPDSGTTPAEYLAAVREDVGGATLRRITGGISGLTTRHAADGSIVYGGTVAAGLIARESGFKGGRPIRVLPFGYVAHDEAADPGSPIRVAVTVGADGIVREVTASWGTRASAWTYSVVYSGLGTTPALAAPEHAKPLDRRLRR